MKTNYFFFTRIVCVLWVLCMISSVSARFDDYENRAFRILDAAGIKGGLIVHVGCGDGKLTAALYSNDGYRIHGQDAQPMNVEKAREYIQSRDLYGPVSIGDFDGKRLPYIDNLVNLLVTEDLGQMLMAPKRAKDTSATSTETVSSQQLHRGPAYTAVQRQTKTTKTDSSTWPTYRGDSARSGRTSSTIPHKLNPIWRSHIGGRLSSLTVSEDKVFISRIGTHTVYALNVDSGEIAWNHTVGGPVDSPLTIYGTMVLFGSHDGWVYCLRARDGELIWRFHAAAQDRFLVAKGAVESVWPVHGSVLVRDGLVWFAAGRSSFLDGGMRLYGLDFASGKCMIAKPLNVRTPESNQSTIERTPATLPDILSASDGVMYMGWTGFDKAGRIVKDVKPHIFSATGFLDDTWWHRTYWQYGTWMRGGFGGWPQAARRVPAGRLLVIDDDSIFGFVRSKYDVGNPERVHAGHVGLIKDTYQDIGRIDYSQNPYQLFCAVKPETGKRNNSKQQKVTYKWQTLIPMLVRGIGR